MNKFFLYSAIGLLVLTSCSKDSGNGIIEPDPTPTPTPTPDPTPDPTPTGYDEKYRPQIHYTPARNWVNDPNGMVYQNGTWHLYYQYNPYGNDWGNMSWGHATSTDLIHWTEQPVAMVKDELGDIFSGSAIIDKNNTAGFGKDAMIAYFTSAGEHQQQSMAYSTDGGITFTKYKGNPIIGNTTRGDFRDPKVFYHEASGKWVMCLALGWEKAAEFWTSSDLINWTYASTFKYETHPNQGIQWECPDLVQLDYNGGKKWVLIINVNPGGPKGGSGIMGFVGDFDGKEFKADDLKYPMWMDFGLDNYAGVTWSNAPDNRTILIGWMNNWMYSGNVPCNPWRSAFTLPREISLVDIDGKPYIASKVVKEIDKIAGDWKNVTGTTGEIPASTVAYQLQLTLPMSEASTFSLINDAKEVFSASTSTIYKQLRVKRGQDTGKAASNISFFSIPSVDGNIYTKEATVTLDIYVDQSSVEIFTADGTMAMTNLVFPSKIYNIINVPASATNVRYRTLKSIWK